MYLLNFKARTFLGRKSGRGNKRCCLFFPLPNSQEDNQVTIILGIREEGDAPPQHLTPQGHHCHNEIVLQLLYNFLLLLILNLKTLLIWLQFFVTHQESRQFRDTCASGIDNLISITIFAITSPNTYQGQFVLETFFFYLFSCCYLLAFNLFF